MDKLEEHQSALHHEIFGDFTLWVSKARKYFLYKTKYNYFGVPIVLTFNDEGEDENEKSLQILYDLCTQKFDGKTWSDIMFEFGVKDCLEWINDPRKTHWKAEEFIKYKFYLEEIRIEKISCRDDGCDFSFHYSIIEENYCASELIVSGNLQDGPVETDVDIAGCRN
jgi:hypothetical protein